MRSWLTGWESWRWVPPSGPPSAHQVASNAGSYPGVFPESSTVLSRGHPHPQPGHWSRPWCSQKEGALQIARPKGSPPLPPFEQWSFKERRYVQWLVDMHNAHYALEASVADATVVASTEHYGEQPPGLSHASECTACLFRHCHGQMASVSCGGVRR